MTAAGNVENVITLPEARFVARCPSCLGDQWELEVDAPKIEVLEAFFCSGCGFRVEVEMTIKKGSDVFPKAQEKRP